MKVFISWSGERSKKVADLLSSWLKCVLQASKPWISSDMDRGVVWFNTINEALADTCTGIVCLTAENLSSPWILFETGSLSHGLTDKRVCTFLIDIKPADVEPPLSQFNHTEPNKTSILSLVKTINSRLGDKQLDAETLDTVFNTYYPQFEKQFNDIISKTETSKGSTNKSVAIRSEQDMLEEVLITVRNLSQRVRRMEGSLPSKTSSSSSNRYILKNEIYEKVLKQCENVLATNNRIITNEADYNTLVRFIADENDMPITVAREVLSQCINLRDLENKECNVDSSNAL